MLKIIKDYWLRRFDRFYRLRYWHLVIDISLIIIILALAFILIKLNAYKPNFNLPIWVAPERLEIDLDNPSLKMDFHLLSKAIHSEDGVLVELYLKNNGQATINNLKLNVVSADDNFSIFKIERLSNYETNPGALQVKGSEISIVEIKPGVEISTQFQVFFKQRVKNSKIVKWQLISEYYLNHQLFKNSLALADIKVASELNVQAAGYYNSPQGDQLGSGPLPPVVDLPTNFWIFFKVEPAGDFEDFILSAKLPKNVYFTDSLSLLAGTLNYSTSSRQVIWRIDSLAEGGSDYRAGFEVQLIPTKEQSGQEAGLINNVKFQALDSFSDLKMAGAISSLDTNLEHDTINKGEGKVLAE